MRYDSDVPRFCGTFWHITKTIKGQSAQDHFELLCGPEDVFRFMKLMRAGMPVRSDWTDYHPDVDLEFIRSITTSDIFEAFSLIWPTIGRKIRMRPAAYGITPTARARKLSAIKSFYKYLTVRRSSTVNPWQIWSI